jgi:hypothetical protein
LRADDDAQPVLEQAGGDGEKIVKALEKDYNADPRIGVRLKEIMAVK